MALQTHLFPYGADNYGLLIHCEKKGITACVDAGDEEATNYALRETGWKLSHIFITHHHSDHTAALSSLKKSHNAKVIGPFLDSAVSDLYDLRVDDNDDFMFGEHRVKVIATPGHTLDMVNFYFTSEDFVCTGDTLFVLGCGRLFEGTAEQMWKSLEKLLKLSDQTVIYCSHEYTIANAKFAMSVDPKNTALRARSDAIQELRDNNLPSIPSRIDLEKATNPFLRVGDSAIREHLGMRSATNEEVFAELRKRKDNF